MPACVVVALSQPSIYTPNVCEQDSLGFLYFPIVFLFFSCKISLWSISLAWMQVKTESRCSQCWALFISKDEEEDLDDRNHNGKGSNMVVTCNADGSWHYDVWFICWKLQPMFHDLIATGYSWYFEVLWQLLAVCISYFSTCCIYRYTPL